MRYATHHATQYGSAWLHSKCLNTGDQKQKVTPFWTNVLVRVKGGMICQSNVARGVWGRGSSGGGGDPRRRVIKGGVREGVIHQGCVWV